MANEIPSVLYEDDAIIAVNKPSGMLVHRGWDNDPVVLTDIVRGMLGADRAHPLHRLDRGTSGVIVFAKSRLSAGRMRTAFDLREVEKRYLALVRGVAPERGIVDHPIPAKEGGPRVSSLTEFRRVAAAETSPRHVSLVEAFPRTGRLHQVRRHLKHISHPVIGDANYGKGPINRAMAGSYGLRRLALHACMIKLAHPDTGDELEIVAPMPADLREPLERMGFDPEVLS